MVLYVSRLPCAELDLEVLNRTSRLSQDPFSIRRMAPARRSADLSNLTPWSFLPDVSADVATSRTVFTRRCWHIQKVVRVSFCEGEERLPKTAQEVATSAETSGRNVEIYCTAGSVEDGLVCVAITMC